MKTTMIERRDNNNNDDARGHIVNTMMTIDRRKKDNDYKREDRE